MISSHKFVAVGVLLLVFTIFIVGAYSRTIDNHRAVKKHVQDELVLYKRQADDPAPKSPEKHHRAHRPPTPSRKPAHAEGDKAATKKRKAAKAKKLVDDVIDADKTTTKKPKEKSDKSSGSTEKPRKPARSSTKKPAKKDDKRKDKSKDEDSSDGDEEKEKKRTTQKPASSKNHKMKTEEKLKVANERWLQNQEVVAIEHMLAGVYDWMKVLKQTGGKTYNRKTAGELFDKVNNELSSMLSEQNKPKKLMSYYRQMKVE